jgi:lysophospholipase L1-like esterase
MPGGRRSFVAGAAVGLAGLVSATDAVASGTNDERPRSLVRDGDLILFIGDSVTDSMRNRARAHLVNDHPGLGFGFACLAATQLLLDHPGAGLRVFNRGLSGDRVPDLAARWQQDCLQLRPDLLTIMVGINDFQQRSWKGRQEGAHTYERDYRQLLARTRDRLPDSRLVLCEPFALPGFGRTDLSLPELAAYGAVVRRLAAEFDARFVPSQAVIGGALRVAPARHWLLDGVHPTAFGASLLAHAWLRTADPAGAPRG